MKRKGQGAMEFLMTYGWALLIVIVAFGTLVFYFGIDEETFTTEYCILGPGLGCTDAVINENTLSLKVINSMGRDLGEFYISSKYCLENSENIRLDDKEEVLLILTGCDYPLGELVQESPGISYRFLGSTIEHVRNASLLYFVEPGELLGDVVYDMEVYADVVVKDIHGLTKGFGVATHPFVHPKFLEAYILEVGVEDVTVRLNHETETLGRNFPPKGIHESLSFYGAKVMVFIRGIPAEEGVAYCVDGGYVGETCTQYESHGPAKNLEEWKNYVKGVVSFYNSYGVNYFIIWNEPNFDLLKNWRKVCEVSNSNCWEPTMEEFVDLTVAGVQAINEQDPSSEVGVDATSAFFGLLKFEDGSNAVVPIEIFDALESNGLQANHHYHQYDPNPYVLVPGGNEELAIANWKLNNNAYLGSNLDEFSDGLEGRASINGDGIHASSYAMATIANAVNFDIDNMGWFQLYSNTHEEGTLEGNFLGLNENMIDKSGVFKPVFWLSKLLHEAPGTLLVDDDLDESKNVRAFFVRNEVGDSYCMYGVNFNRIDESATLNIRINGLDPNIDSWNYKTYKIGHDDGNPYRDDVEPEIEALLQPIIDDIENTPGATWTDYIYEAWPEITSINGWESVRPTEFEKTISSEEGIVTAQITLEAQEVRVLCLEAI